MTDELDKFNRPETIEDKLWYRLRFREAELWRKYKSATSVEEEDKYLVELAEVQNDLLEPGTAL